MKLSHLRNIIRESIKELMLEYTYTQAEGNAICAGAGHGPMTGYSCESDGPGSNTETCTISCEGGMVTVGGGDTPLALDKTKHVDRSNTNKPPRPTRRNIR